MKKLLFIGLMTILSLTTFAQNNDVDKRLDYSQTFVYFTGVAADTMGIGDSTWTYTVNKYNDEPITMRYYLDADSVSANGTDSICIYLEGKVFTEESYTRLDTVVWHVSADTTFSVDYNTQSDYQYWRVKLEASVDEMKAEIQKLLFKFLK